MEHEMNEKMASNISNNSNDMQMKYELMLAQVCSHVSYIKCQTITARHDHLRDEA